MLSPKLKHWVTICAEPLALVHGVRESRRDGTYSNYGLQSVGRATARATGKATRSATNTRESRRDGIYGNYGL